MFKPRYEQTNTDKINRLSVFIYFTRVLNRTLRGSKRGSLCDTWRRAVEKEAATVLVQLKDMARGQNEWRAVLDTLCTSQGATGIRSS